MKNLGIDGSGVARMSWRELLAAVQSGQKAVLSNGWEMVGVRASYERRIKIRRDSPFSAAEIGILKELGAFVERVDWTQGVFLPVGEDGLAVFEHITASKPVVDLFAARLADAALGPEDQGKRPSRSAVFHGRRRHLQRVPRPDRRCLGRSHRQP